MRLPDGGVHEVGEVHHCNAVKWNFVVILKGAGGRLVRFIVVPINKHGYLKHLLLRLQFSKQRENKPDRATMRPGCVSACIDHATYVWRDRWTNRRVKRLSKHVG